MDRRLALVTGASAGIGAAFARIYASHGYDVALTARRGERLERLAEEIRLRYGVETLTLTADLALPDAPRALLDGLAAHGRVVDALVNNAGFGPPGGYADVSWDDQQTFLNLMVVNVCALAHHVLPGMVERRFGRIVNVSSVAGLVPGAAGHTLYGAAKSFMVRFSQSLHQEAAPAGVHVTALCPGFTYSEFHDVNGTRDLVARSIPEWMWMGADEVAAVGYEAAEANRAIAVPGAPNKALVAFARVLPEEWVMALVASQSNRFRRM